MARSKIPPRAVHGSETAAIDALSNLVSELTTQLSTTRQNSEARLTRLQAAAAENQERLAAAIAEKQTRPSAEEVRVLEERLAGQEEEIAALKRQLAERRSPPPTPPTLDSRAMQTAAEEPAGRDVDNVGGEGAGKTPRRDEALLKAAEVDPEDGWDPETRSINSSAASESSEGTELDPDKVLESDSEDDSSAKRGVAANGSNDPPNGSNGSPGVRLTPQQVEGAGVPGRVEEWLGDAMDAARLQRKTQDKARRLEERMRARFQQTPDVPT